MPGTARRLVRRYLPEGVRKTVASVTRSGRWSDEENEAGYAGDRSPPSGTTRWSRHSARDGPWRAAVLVQIRSLLEAGEPHTAASIAASLRKEPESAALGALASAIVAFHRGYLALAWTEFAAVPPPLRWRHAASEYVRAGIRTDRATVLEDVRRLVGEDPDSVGRRQLDGDPRRGLRRR